MNDLSLFHVQLCGQPAHRTACDTEQPALVTQAHKQLSTRGVRALPQAEGLLTWSVDSGDEPWRKDYRHLQPSINFRAPAGRAPPRLILRR